jgi:hypothetical protein
MLTVYLEDHGQDFLEWDIKDGAVVDSRPYQAWVWNGTIVHNENIKRGDILNITSKIGTRMTIKYPVVRVKRVSEKRQPELVG